MEEEKEVSVEKEIKERANKIAAKLSNEHNIITLRGEKVSTLLSMRTLQDVVRKLWHLLVSDSSRDIIN